MSLENLTVGQREHLYIDSFEIGESSISCRFFLKEDFRIFASHFAGDPILPGVLQGRMLENACLVFLNKLGHQKAAVKSFDNLKFKNPVRPNTELVFECTLSRLDEEEGVGYFSGNVKTSDGVLCAAGKLQMYLESPYSIKSCSPPEDRSIFIDSQQIADYIPHGTDMRFVDEVNEVRWCPTTVNMLNDGRRQEILFPDMVESEVFSRVRLGSDRYLLDDFLGEGKIFPAANHVEISAQTGIFIIWNIKPDDVEIQTILLGYSCDVISPVPEGATVENRVKLISSRGNPTKGYMNFFEAELSCGDVVFSKLKYSAICTYLRP